MKRKYIIPMCIISFILVITVFLSLLFLNYVQNLIKETTSKNLGEIAKQDASRLENVIQEHVRILETIVNQAKQEGIKQEEVLFKIFNNNSGKEEFSRIGILHKDGNTVTNDGINVDLSADVEYFFSTDESQISKSRVSKINQEEINIYSQKLSIENQEIVVLLVIETDKYEEMFSQKIYNGNAREYLITSSGEILANSKGEKNGENIYAELEKINKEQEKNKNNIRKMQDSISKKIDGQIVYKYQGQNLYIAYENMEEENWVLVVITQGNIIAEELNHLLQIILVISIIILIIVFVVTTYIILSNISKKESLYRLAYVDPITKLGNYNYFVEKGKEYLERKTQDNKYVIVVDIDKFKAFNNRYGHKIGDKLLSKIGNILKLILPEETLICRLANDLFALVVITDKRAEKIANLIDESLTNIQIDNIEYKIYISIGIYEVKENNDNIIELVDKALVAHKMVKGNYNIRYNVFEQKEEEKELKEHEIERTMEKALENQEFKIYYQPKISTKNEKMLGAESLVRWEKEGKIIPPNEFIPIFEKNYFIIELDKYVFEETCKDIAKWKKEYKEIPLISVNVSKENFINPEFIEEYIKIAKKYNIRPEEIELEITERGAVKENINIINKIKKAGFIVSIDDFGTGYSSLSLLQDLTIDIIKIDREFIKQINFKDKSKNIVEYIILMAKKLNLKTVAEGVEKKEEVEYLKELGCDLIQGYYYFKPLTKLEFEEILIKTDK